MKDRLIKARDRPLGLPELIAIALGGMVGGGIFSVLGVSVEFIGRATPVAILIGGALAFFAAYSYVKLALYYKDEGATYSFFKKTFPASPFSAAVIGWFVVFGYISTLALYAFTFASYFGSLFPTGETPWLRTVIAGSIILVFAIINLVSVKGMGKVEDVMVYTKLVLLLFIAGLLAGKGDIQRVLPLVDMDSSIPTIVMIAALTFVAFEGFQLVVHAYREMETPERNVPRAIYSAIVIATLLYVVLAVGALSAIPQAEIIADKEYALAAGSERILGRLGYFVVLFGALLATSSAISGTLFGASRLMAVIADDGHFPRSLGFHAKLAIPRNAIVLMSLLAFLLILFGGLRIILEFGSVTFILVSFLMAVSNFKMRKETGSHVVFTLIAMIGLFAAGTLIIVFELQHSPEQLIPIGVIYAALIAGAWLRSKWIAQRGILAGSDEGPGIRL